jgi:polygalacturonase
MLFAEPPEQNPPKLGDPNVVNIMDYKVDNTGKTVETAKINQAISDVSAKPGGGVLFFPTGGIYMTGTLLMKSNVQLYVDAGALIKGTGKIADYTSAPAPPGGRPLRAQVIFDNVENAGLAGRGAVDSCSASTATKRKSRHEKTRCCTNRKWLRASSDILAVATTGPERTAGYTSTL